MPAPCRFDSRPRSRRTSRASGTPALARNRGNYVPKRKDNFGNEAFSTKIFEFMAMRIPVVGSDTRIDQYYFDNSLVRFFQGGDEDDLARCTLDLIQHPEKRRSLVENAGEFIDKNDWNVKKEVYLELVARLTNPQRVVHAQ